MSNKNRGLSSTLCITLEATSWLAAAVLLGWSVRGWAEAATFQHQHRHFVASEAARGADGFQPLPGSPIAALSIPRLGMDVVVVEGTSPEFLGRAAGRISRSARPGEGGNVAIAAHRDSFFRPLRDVEVGDLIVLSSGSGDRRYRVEWTRIVDPDEVEVLSSTDYPALTLITCYPFHYVGNAPQRFIVRARDERGTDLDPAA